jgi:hypothetical protein
MIARRVPRRNNNSDFSTHNLTGYSRITCIATDSINIEALIPSIIINGLPSMSDAYSIHARKNKGFSTPDVQVFAL